jgi:imidazole glycerol-phosphate synthase subunit HisH
LIAILDYGIGNLRSVEKAVRRHGFDCRIQPETSGADKLILPGVGAFGAAMERLAPVADEVREFAASGKPVFGICLGQQLLFEESEEQGTHQGLGLLRGKVRYFPTELGLKVPHVGWNQLRPLESGSLMSGISEGEQVYFVHSLYVECDDAADVAATSVYGVEFPAAVRRGNIWGAQFHPEKSGDVGLRILANFLKC